MNILRIFILLIILIVLLYYSNYTNYENYENLEITIPSAENRKYKCLERENKGGGDGNVLMMRQKLNAITYVISSTHQIVKMVLMR